MRVEIELINYHFCNCFEAVLANMAKWIGRDYELMYINEWDFSYYPPKDLSNRLGRSLALHFDKRNALDRFYGIKYVEFTCDNFTEVLKLFKNELKSNSKFPLARLDTYFLPWDKSYGRVHNKIHIVFITDIDHENQILHIADPFYLIKDQAISFDEFQQSYSGKYGLFEIGRDNSGEVDGRELLRSVLSKLYEKDAFNLMRAFADDLAGSYSREVETHGFENMWETPLYFNIANIETSRKRIAPFLFHIADRYGFKGIYQSQEEINLLAPTWDGIKNSFIKLLMSDGNLHVKLAQKIRGLADYEEKTANHLYRLLR